LKEAWRVGERRCGARRGAGRSRRRSRRRRRSAGLDRRPVRRGGGRGERHPVEAKVDPAFGRGAVDVVPDHAQIGPLVAVEVDKPFLADAHLDRAARHREGERVADRGHHEPVAAVRGRHHDGVAAREPARAHLVLEDELLRRAAGGDRRAVAARAGRQDAPEYEGDDREHHHRGPAAEVQQPGRDVTPRVQELVHREGLLLDLQVAEQPDELVGVEAEVLRVGAEESHGVGLAREDGEVLVLEGLEEAPGHVRVPGDLVQGVGVLLARQPQLLSDRFHAALTLRDRTGSRG
jgi:hypothetical protein